MKYRHKICKEDYKRVERESDVEATSDIVDSDDSLSKDTITQTQLISDNGSYSTACRKAIYYCLEYEVPVSAACSVIKAAIRELSGFSLGILPCNSTVAMMAYVFGVISDLQVGEVRYTQDNITLSWDSTSVDDDSAFYMHQI